MKWQLIIACTEAYRFAMIDFQKPLLRMVDKNKAPFLQRDKKRRGFRDY